MILDKYKGKKILILGYGTEGKATEKYISTNYPEISLGIADKIIQRDYLNLQRDYDLIIKTPGISKRHIVGKYTTATNIFFDTIPKSQIIGVTGSKGKSTTASLIAWILSKYGYDVRLVGNIGVPLLQGVTFPINKQTIFVCELSSYQLDDVIFSPHISVIMSLFPEHIPYHQTVDKYYSAKKNMIHFVDKKDYFIYNSQFDELNKWAKSFCGIAVSYDKNPAINDSKLIGDHNISNIKAATSVASIYKIPHVEIVKHVQSFKPLPYRLENLGFYNNICFYDDSISTAPQSTIAALNSLDNVDTLLLGGENRGYDFSELVQKMSAQNIANIVLFPDSGHEILKLLKKIKDYRPKILFTDSMEKAVEFAYKNTQKNKICLLSSASPSYSLWPNYVVKGKLFQRFVKEYAKKK